MNITCACGGKLRVGEEMAGKVVRCPKCGERLQVLEVEEEPAISKSRSHRQDWIDEEPIHPRKLKQPRKPYLLIGAAVVCFVAASIVAGVVIARGRKGEPPEDTRPAILRGIAAQQARSDRTPPETKQAQSAVAHRGLRGESGAHCVAWSPDGKTIATSTGPGNEEIKLWDVQTGRRIISMSSTMASCCHLTFSRSGKLIAAGGAGELYIWEVGKTEPLFKHRGEGNMPKLGDKVVGFSSEADLLVSVEQGSVNVVEVNTGVVTRHPIQIGFNSSAACSPTEPIIAVARPVSVRPIAALMSIYDFRKKEEERAIEISFIAHCMAFSRDGKSLVAASTGGQLIVYDTQTWKEKARLNWKPPGKSDFLGFDHLDVAPDGSRCACVPLVQGRPNVHEWKVGTDNIRPLASDWCEEIAYSPDGKLLAEAVVSEGVKIIDVATGEEKLPTE
jgi:sugar lactone lactonase YvrE